MNTYEYQGKKLFAEFGIPVPQGKLLDNPQEAPWFEGGSVVKAQVLTGGRGKAGAIKKCNSPEETVAAAEQILGMTVKGFKVHKLLVEEVVDTIAEYYFSISTDRNNRCITMMFTDQGGMDIESVPADKMGVLHINTFVGVRAYMLKSMLAKFGLDKDKELIALMQKCYGLFVEKKLQLLEINPLARKADGSIIALDSKVIMDDAAIDPSIDMTDMGEGDMTAFERTMRGWGVTAVEVDPEGDIILLGNGAGCAVCSTDSIIHRGGSVRALIDLGTMGIIAKPEDREAFTINVFHYIAEQKPKAFFFNSYFQSFPWSYWADILKKAFSDSGIDKELPVVLRVSGYGAAEAMELLKDTNMHVTDSFEEGCGLTIRLSKGEQ